MQNLFVWTDELYPYFRLERKNVAGARPIQISEVDYVEYERIRADFFNWQTRLKEMRK
jgi:hypothetical protein